VSVELIAADAGVVSNGAIATATVVAAITTIANVALL
jgi:hypothetical protein